MVTFLGKIRFDKQTKSSTIWWCFHTYNSEEDLIYFESYIGIARPFKLWGELVKFGLYGCTSVNSYTGSTFELKIGVSSFNPFTKK